MIGTKALKYNEQPGKEIHTYNPNTPEAKTEQ
jgi:hypothetical protein